MKKFVVFAYFVVIMFVSVVLGILQATEIANMKWWVPVVVFVVGLIGAAGTVADWVSSLRREEREILRSVGSKVAKEVLDSYVESREPEILRAIARSISEGL
jgi:hypothetical protein